MKKQITTNLPPAIHAKFRVLCAEAETNPTRKLAELATRWVKTTMAKKEGAK